MQNHRLLTIAIVIVFTSIAQAADETASDRNGEAKVGDKPALRGPSLTGAEEINIRRQRGSLVLVYFWDAPSAASQEVVRQIVPVHQEYASRGLEVIGVVATSEKAELRAHVEKLKADWPHVCISPQEEDTILSDWLGDEPRKLPRLFLLAPDGAILWIGDRESDIEAAIKEGLATNPPFVSLDVMAGNDLIREKRITILDVRTPREFAEGHIQGAVNINVMDEGFADAVKELPKDRQYLVYCRSGGRSMQACEMLSNLQFTRLHNLAGGILAWEKEGLPVAGKSDD